MKIPQITQITPNSRAQTCLVSISPGCSTLDNFDRDGTGVLDLAIVDRELVTDPVGKPGMTGSVGPQAASRGGDAVLKAPLLPPW